MKKREFWEKVDRAFNRKAFFLLCVPNLVCLLLLYAYVGRWPKAYTDTESKKLESELAFERHNDRLIDEFVRPRIEAKYNVKTLRAKTNTDGYRVNVRIETDGTGRYEEIAEDVLRLAPVVVEGVDWSFAPEFENDGTPKDLPFGWRKRNQMRYILEFDHGANDGGVTVFFANGERLPWERSGTSTWHTKGLWARMNVP